MQKIYSFKSLPSPLKIPSQNKPPLLCHLDVKISNSQRLSAENQFLQLLKNIHTMELTIQQFQACWSLPWDSGNNSFYQASSPFYQCPWEAAEADNPDNHTNKRLKQHSSFTGATVTGGDVTAFGWGKVRLWRGICPHSRQGSTGCSKEFMASLPTFSRFQPYVEIKSSEASSMLFFAGRCFFLFLQKHYFGDKN